MKNKLAEIRVVVGGGAVSRLLKSFNLSKNTCSFFQFNKKAFTLAEVLVTLTIIGVVASITVPTLSRNATKHATISTLKSTYSILSQAMHRAQADYGDASEWLKPTERETKAAAELIANNILPYLKIIENCGVNDTENKCISQKYLKRNGTPHSRVYANDTRYYKVVLNNGSAIWMKSTDSTEYNRGNSHFIFFIDTNGAKKPNKFGDDLFVFSYENNKLVPLGALTSYAPYTTDCLPKNSSGYGCAYYILTTDKMDY